MIITSILTIIAFIGTLTIVAYLRQVEEGMAELQEELATPICPVCLEPHYKQKHRSLRSFRNYYKCKKSIASACRSRKVTRK